MEEVAHEAIAFGPVISEDAMMMRAERRVARELESTRCTDAHPHQGEQALCQRLSSVEPATMPSGKLLNSLPE